MAEKKSVIHITVDERGAGQRLDNFLAAHARDVPKSRLYRAIRRGEVRINGRRAKPLQRLNRADEVRIPPLATRASENSSLNLPRSIAETLTSAIAHEDRDLIVINKPAGMAVHGGSGLSWGLIEALRALRSDVAHLELVHRLDRETSGCLVIAKRRSALRRVQRDLRERRLGKTYWAVVHGRWRGGPQTVDEPLLKQLSPSGERVVRIDPDGKPARSHFRPLDTSSLVSLVEVDIETGRTHQIRVHAASLSHPIVGDDKYGHRQRDADWASEPTGLCLHARRISIPATDTTDRLDITVEPPNPFASVLDQHGLTPPRGRH
ncbi:MAG: RluA family pseudouridine synthase [Pseudomonadota bacterium]